MENMEKAAIRPSSQTHSTSPVSRTDKPYSFQSPLGSGFQFPTSMGYLDSRGCSEYNHRQLQREQRPEQYGDGE
jgi:hypothetical protein